MAIAYDAYSRPVEGTGDFSWTHTPVGTPKGVLVYLVTAAAVATTPTVTYGGLTMAPLSVSPLLHASGETCIIHAYFLGGGIPTGPQTVVIDITSTDTRSASCYTFTGDLATTVVQSIATINSKSLENPSATLALSGKTCVVTEVLFSGQDAVTSITPFDGWTSAREYDFGTSTCASYYYNTVANNDVTIGWTQAAEDAVCIAVAITEGSTTISFDAKSSTSGTGDLSWTHTPVGTPKGVLVFVMDTSGTDHVNGVTYGGDAMTEVSGSPLLKTGDEDAGVYCYFKSTPKTGAQTVAVDVNDTTETKLAVCISVTSLSTPLVKTTASIKSGGAVTNPEGTIALGGVPCFVCEGLVTGRYELVGPRPFVNWAEEYVLLLASATGAVFHYDVVATDDVIFGYTCPSDDATCLAVAVYDPTATITSDAEIAPTLFSDAIISYPRGKIQYTAVDTLVFDSSNGAIPKIIRLNTSDYYAIASYDGNTNAGSLYTAHITTSGLIDSAVTDSWQFSAYSVTPSITHISGTVYSISSQTSASTGSTSTLSISNSGVITNSFIDTLSFGNTDPYSYTLPVANSVYTAAIGDGLLKTYEILGDGTIGVLIIDSFSWGTSAPYGFVDTTFGYFAVSHGERTIKTVQITQSGAITPNVISTWEFEPSVGSTPHIIHVFHHVYAVVYENSTGGCTVKTFTIRPEDGAILGPIDTFTLDASAGTVPRIYHVGGDVYVVAYSTSLLAGRLTTIGISFTGVIQQSIIDTFDYDATRGYWADLAFISDQGVFGSIFALTYWGPSNEGVLKTVRIQQGDAYPTEYSTTISSGAVIAGRSIFSDALITIQLSSDATIYDNIRSDARIYGLNTLSSDAFILYPYINSDANIKRFGDTSTIYSGATIYISDTLAISSNTIINGRAHIPSDAEIRPYLYSDTIINGREHIFSAAEVFPYLHSGATIRRSDGLATILSDVIINGRAYLPSDAEIFAHLHSNTVINGRAYLTSDSFIAFASINSDAEIFAYLHSGAHIQKEYTATIYSGAHIRKQDPIFTIDSNTIIEGRAYLTSAGEIVPCLYSNAVINGRAYLTSDGNIWPNLKSNTRVYGLDTLSSDAEIFTYLHSDAYIFGHISTQSNSIIRNTAWVIERAMLTGGPSGGGTCVADSHLFTFGVDGTKSVQEYDPYTNTWTYRENMPTPRCGSAVTELNRQIYVISGGDCEGGVEPLANEVFTPYLGTWNTLAPIPEGRLGASAAAVNGKIYVLGGDTLSSSRRNDEYDPATNTWEIKANIPQRRGCSAIIAYNNKIHIISGKDSAGVFYTDHHIYTPATDTYEVGASIPVAVEGARAILMGTAIYVIGGMKDDSTVSASVQVYHIETDSWDPIIWPPDMHYARYDFAAGVIDGVIIVAGGAVGSEEPASTESFNSLTSGNILSNALVLHLTYIESDARITAAQFIQSDATIYITETQTISSDSIIQVSETIPMSSDTSIYVVDTQTIDSNGHIWRTDYSYIDSNATIQVSETIPMSSDSRIYGLVDINSNGHIQTTETITIDSDATIQVTETQTINSDAHIQVSESVDILSDMAITPTRLIYSNAYIVQITRAAVMAQPSQRDTGRLDPVQTKKGIQIF